jgi:protein TonB
MKRAMTMALAAVAAMSVGGLSAGAAPGPDEVHIKTMTASMADYYPNRAAMDHVEGVAKVDCVVQTTGRLAGCVVISEAPQGYGFGAAAVKLTRFITVDLNLDAPGKHVTYTAGFTLE